MENFNDDIEQMIADREKEIEEKDNDTKEEEIIENKEEQEVEGSGSNEDNKQEDSTIKEREIEGKFAKIDFEHNGSTYNINSEEELMGILKNGLGNKSEDLSNSQKLIKQENIPEEKLTMMIDAMNGDKEALVEMLKTQNINPLDLIKDEDEAEIKYTPKVELIEESELDKIANVILRDDAWTKSYRDTLDIIPCSDFKKQITTDAAALSFFSKQVKDGTAEQIIPEATILSITNRIPFTDAYIQVGKKMESKNSEKDLEKEKKKEILTGSKGNPTGSKGSTDAWKMSNKDFDKLWE